MANYIMVGDTVTWNDCDYKQRKVLDSQHTGTVIAINNDLADGLAIVRRDNDEPSVPVYVHRLTATYR